jgi:transcriptional regulator with XRE-family HTH domain
MKTVRRKTIPNSLRKYRRARGLTQKDVARILGLESTSLISRWESGFCLPKAITIFKLAVLYRTMADALFIDLRRLLQKDILRAEKKVMRNKPSSQNNSNDENEFSAIW